MAKIVELITVNGTARIQVRIKRLVGIAIWIDYPGKRLITAAANFGLLPGACQRKTTSQPSWPRLRNLMKCGNRDVKSMTNQFSFREMHMFKNQ